LVFGTVIVLAPVGVFLLWNMQWRSILRYVWLPGVFVFLAVALPWPYFVYQSHPDVLEVWTFDLIGRLNQNYLGQPPWYYLECLTWVPQPWTIPAIGGLVLTFPKAFREGSAADRFVWCWAIAPMLVFSLSQGKHHHYMLHYLAPWAMLAGQAVVWAWGKVAERWPNFQPRVALIAGFAGLLALYAAGFTVKGIYLHRSREDTAFLYEVRQVIPLEKPLMINSADEALEGLRMQFYIGDTVYFLHNLSFVCDNRVHGDDVYVVTRYNRLAELAKYGQVEPMLKCKHSRREQSEADRWTLFHVHLRDDLPRRSVHVPISPMQAMYRTPGPMLD
jgi:hypothetical protein